MFKEEEHPRDNDGKFTEKGNGGGSYQEGVDERIEWARENGVDLPLNADGSLDDLKLQEIKESKKSSPILSKREYAVLRQEVIRKNAAQKGKVKPTNFAYTSDYFYVYSTQGDDDFSSVVQLNIEENRDIINKILKKFEE